MTVEVRRIQTDSEREACYAIRYEVFVDEQQVPPWEEVDDLDDIAIHFVAIIDGEVVGTARLLAVDPSKRKIGRVAVKLAHRSTGVGKALMVKVMEEAWAEAEEIQLAAQIAVIPFYEKLGFQAIGPEFTDGGIPHRKMTAARNSD